MIYTSGPQLIPLLPLNLVRLMRKLSLALMDLHSANDDLLKVPNRKKKKGKSLIFPPSFIRYEGVRGGLGGVLESVPAGEVGYTLGRHREQRAAFSSHRLLYQTPWCSLNALDDLVFKTLSDMEGHIQYEDASGFSHGRMVPFVLQTPGTGGIRGEIEELVGLYGRCCLLTRGLRYLCEILSIHPLIPQSVLKKQKKPGE
ncbi:unnamed protein product [Pleuronectes platessa]|uniref:Uncharacterized protein n=1 Tax=Pleuronectes platessa TaxID=8262 RepID=A0A9N7Z568_PLEPL|nr:unnamed protein product [Pleuronectes platessa]